MTSAKDQRNALSTRGAGRRAIAWVTLAAGILLAGCAGAGEEAVQQSQSRTSTDEVLSPWEANELLARSVNLGGVYEVDRDETWAIPFELDDLAGMADHGFSAVRLPILWPDWAESVSPYTIESELFDTIDAVVGRALVEEMAVIVDLHYYPELNLDPAAHRDRFIEMWRQIAEHYQHQPDRVFFELFNEPYEQLGGDTLNDLMADTVRVVRESNPNRILIVGPGDWNSPLALEELELPKDDHLILTVHQYEPFEFTHQGASWVEGSGDWLGTTFSSVAEDEAAAALVEEFAMVADWAQDRDIPVFVGEFGSISEADHADRLDWTRFIRGQAEAHGFSWGYWDWAGPNFGLLNQETGEWNDNLLDALIP